MTIKEALEKWNQWYPSEKVTAQTMKNWGRKYGFIENAERIVRNHKVKVNEEKFDVFLKNPSVILVWTKTRGIGKITL